MFLTDWLARVKERFGVKKIVRRTSPQSLGSRLLVETLEDRLVLSAVVMPANNIATALKDVFFTGDQTVNNVYYPKVPEKVMSFTNNITDLTVYPFFRDPNTGQPKSSASFWDPMDPHQQEYRGYVGYRALENGAYTNYLGLLPGQTVSLTVPLVFWDSGRLNVAADGRDIIGQNAAAPLLQNPFRYDENATRFITKPDLTTYEPTYVGPLVMWYHAPVARDVSNDALVQLTEYTIRDQYLGILPNPSPLPAGEVKSLVNYDVSYVDSMILSVAMEATNVPIPIGLPEYNLNSGPIGAVPGTSAGQADGKTLLLNHASDPDKAILQRVADFVALGYSITVTSAGIAGAGVLNPDVKLGTKVVSVDVNTGIVKLSDDTVAAYRGEHTYTLSGPVKDFAWIGSKLTYTDLQAGIQQFTSSTANGGILGTYFGGQGYPFYNKPYADAPIKIPSGQNLVFQSPLAGTRSTYSPFGPLNQWMLSSGGTEAIGAIPGGTSVNPFPDKFTLQPNQILLNYVTDLDKSRITLLQGLLAGGFTLTVTTDPVANSDIQAGTILTDVKPITDVPELKTFAVATLTKDTIAANRGGHAYVIQRPTTDYAMNTLTDLWYSWAKYYADNVNATPVSNRSGTILAGGRELQIDTTGLVVGMTVTGTGIPTDGIPTTVLSVDTTKGTVHLSRTSTSGGAQNYNFAVPTFAAIAGSSDPLVHTYPLTAAGTGNSPALLLSFSRAVYEAMAVFSEVRKSPGLPVPFELLGNVIGCNVGFLTNPDDTINGEVRDIVKSILRGVPDFRAPGFNNEDTDWYPDPKTPMAGQTFNVYNLDPFVWFVHRVLKLSGYGFSVDDDVADVQSNYGNSLAFSISGLNPFKNTYEWSNGAPFGTVQAQSRIFEEGGKYFISLKMGAQSTLPEQALYWQIFGPSDIGPGALVTGEGIKTGTRVKGQGPLVDLVLELDTQPEKTGTYLLTFSGTLNSLPTMVSSPSFSLAENSVAVGSVVTVGTGLPAQNVTYAISGGADQSKFAINQTTGALSFKSAPNFEVPTDLNGDNLYLLQVSASDGVESASQNITVAVTNVNEAPVNTVPGTQSVTTSNAILFSSANGNAIRISDVDSGAGNLTVNLKTTAGTLAIAVAYGNTTYTGYSTNNLTLQGNLTDLNKTLGTLFYQSGAAPGNATLTITTNDNGNSGSGAPLTDIDTVNLVVQSLASHVNVAPTANVPGNQTITPATAFAFNDAGNNTISVGDIDAGYGTVQLTLTVAQGRLNFGTTVGLTFVSGTTNNSANIVVRGRLDHINFNLQNLTYTSFSSFNGADTLTVKIEDLGASGMGGNKSDTKTVKLVGTPLPVNQAPVNTVPAAQVAVAGKAMLFSAANGNAITIADPDAGTRTVSVNLKVNIGTLAIGIAYGNVVYSGYGSNNLTLTGSIDNLNKTLGTLFYQAGAPIGPDTLTITTNDLENLGTGGAKTDIDTVALNVQSLAAHVNVAPTITAPVATQNATMNGTFAFNTANNTIRVGDIDAGYDSVQVTLAVGHGKLNVTPLGAGGPTVTGNGTGTLTLTGRADHIDYILQSLQYTPTSGYTGGDTLAVNINDQGRNGTGGAKQANRNVNVQVT